MATVEVVVDEATVVTVEAGDPPWGEVVRPSRSPATPESIDSLPCCSALFPVVVVVAVVVEHGGGLDRVFN